MNYLFSILCILLLASCQVKETKSSGGLIADNVPVDNAFTISSSLSGYFKATDPLDIKLRFPFNVSVTGVPFIPITVGSTARQADYVSGNGTKELTFRYVVGAETDTNGIDITGLINLNSGTLTFNSAPGVTTNCALNFTAPTTSLIVDSTVPVQGALTNPSAGLYTLGQKVTFTLAYNEVVVVTGTPSIDLTVGVATKQATYQSGSGTSTLTFSYTVASGDKDLNNIDRTIQNLNGGSITDRAGNTAPFTVSSLNLANVLVQDVPTVVSTSAVSANGTYLNGQSISFTQTFNRVITVTGSPRIALTVGSSTRYATYASGSGTSALVFTYNVLSPDYDADGITVTPIMVLNGGTMTDSNGDPLIKLTFNAPTTTGIQVDATQPVISSITPPANATYLLGQNMNFTVNFDRAVTVTGAPTLDFVLGSSTVTASYISGSGSTALLFRYIPISGDLDSDGIALSVISLNAGSIRSSGGNNADLTLPSTTTTGVQVNAVLPTIASFSAPANSTYLLGQAMNFTVIFSRAVTVVGTPRIPFTTTDGLKYANYLSGSGTNTLVFRYTVVASNYDYDGIAITSPVDLNGGSIKDTYNYTPAMTFTVPNTSAVLVDTIAATITSVAVPSAATYTAGNVLSFIFTFSKTVTITGAPRVAMVFGATTVYAIYASGSGTSNIVFNKTIVSPETDADGITLSTPLQLNGGTIIDSSGIAATLTYTLPTTSGILIDTGPYVTSVTPPTNGTYLTAQNLNFVLTFNNPVNITGLPRLVLNIGGTTRYANYFSGTGTSTITFRHSVQSNDTDNDGIGITPTMDLNGGTIRDASLNSSSLNFTAPDLSGVNVDAVLPALTSVTLPSNGLYTSGGQLNFTVTFNKPITVVGTPRIVLSMGPSTVYANYVSGSGTSSLLFRYTLIASSFDMDGIAIGNSNNIDLNGGTLKDAVLNNAPVALGVQDLSSVLVTYPGLGAWYDGNDASTFTTVFSSPNYQISNWNDKSGNSYHATQVTPANRPYYISSGFGTQNRPYANTNLATHYMNLVTGVPNVQHVITVFRSPPTLASAYLYFGVTVAVRMNATGALSFAPAAQWKLNGGTQQSATTATAASVVTNSANYILSTSFSSGQTITAQKIGHATSSMINGQIAEMIIFTSSATLTDTELTVIHNYLNTKYGIY